MLTAVLACNGYSILSSWWAFSAERNYNSIIYGVTSSLTLQLNTNVLDLNPIFLLSIRCEVTQQSLNLRVGQSLPGHRHSPR